jgi:hypothetical protein
MHHANIQQILSKRPNKITAGDDPGKLDFSGHNNIYGNKPMGTPGKP